MKSLKLLFFALAVLALGACSQSSPMADSASMVESGASTIEIHHQRVFTAPPMAPVTGGFMVILNHSDQADALIGASSDIAKNTEIHKTEMDGDMMRMIAIPRLELAPKSETELKPGGLHVMFIGLTKPINEGDKVMLTLTFEKAGEVKLELPVVQRGMDSGPMHRDGMNSGMQQGMHNMHHK